MSFLKGVFSRWVRLPRVIAALLLVAVMAYGVYGMATSSFLRWLSMPFTASAEGGEGFRGGEGRPSDGGSFPVESQTSDSDSATAAAQTTGGTTTDSLADGASAQTVTDSSTDSGAEAMTTAEFGGVRPGGSGHESAGSFTGAITTLAQFASIACLFAALTAFLDTLRKRMRRAQA